MAYKLAVSPSPVRVGIPGNLNIVDTSPWLTLQNALVSVSSSDSATGTDSTYFLSAIIPDTNTSVGAEASSLNIIERDSSVTTDSAVTNLFPSDTDSARGTETQSVLAVISQADSSSISDTHVLSEFITDSDSVLGSETLGFISDAVTSTDSVLGSELGTMAPDFQSSDFSVGTENFVSLVVFISDRDSVLGADSQPLFLNNLDSIVLQEFASSNATIQDTDSGTLKSETVSFGISTQLVMEWAVFPHLNQVVFAQPLNQ